MESINTTTPIRLSGGNLLKPKPVTPGLRHHVKVNKSGLHRGSPAKNLTKGANKRAGRNNQGRITARHRGGGHKRKYRLLDRKLRPSANGTPEQVVSIEHDPYRSAWIALLQNTEGQLRYVVSTQGLAVGDYVSIGLSNDTITTPPVGTVLELGHFSVGDQVHSIELVPGGGPKIVRGAGCYGQVLHKISSEGLVRIRLPSGEERLFPDKAKATLGQVSNLNHRHRRLGKAGRKRWLGRRPHVRGVAMNPVDHPHGGGEGKTSGGGGYRSSVSPWGVPTKGYVTRKGKWPSNVIVPRKRGWERRR